MTGFGEIAYAREIMKAGFSPWWNPLLSCGTPLFAQPGLALGYPGTLITLLAPGDRGAIIFTAMHALLAFAGFRSLALKRLPPASSFLMGAVLAGLAAYLGASFHPSILAAMAWGPWALMASGAPAFACWALVFSCGDAAVAVVAITAAGLLRAKGSLRYLLMALGASALVFTATLQAQRNTRALEAGFPDLTADEGRALKSLTRESRIYFDPKTSSAISHTPVMGPAWVGGSRRPVRWVADSFQALALDPQARDEQLSLRGASLLFSTDGKTRSQVRLHAPFRAGFVSAATYLPDPRAASEFSKRPFLSRPLLLNDASPHSETPAAGALWTLLPMQPNALGEFSVALPSGHGPGWLYASDAWYPGWIARSDGKPSPMLRAEGAFRAVYVESDAKIVAISYRPWLIYLAWGFSLFMLIFSALKPRLFAGMR